MQYRDQTQQAAQKIRRAELRAQGLSGRQASQQAKAEHPLPRDQAKSKNRQP